MITQELIPIQKLNKDTKEGCETLGDREARFLVDTYYQMQHNRIQSGNQLRSLEENAEPFATASYFSDQFEMLENQIKKALDIYSSNHPVGIWMRSIVGIGPVIASGFLSHIDIKKAPTVGHIWSFCGLDPTKKWNKKEKRPWNAALKTLCWKLGESFVKVSNHPHDVYGNIYAERKQLELANNECGEYKESAKESLELKNYGKTTDAYKYYSEGKLPPARIHLRAQRYAVKIFLSHLHEVWFLHEFKMMPPKPYILTLPGHTHKIEVTNKHLITARAPLNLSNQEN